MTNKIWSWPAACWHLGCYFITIVFAYSTFTYAGLIVAIILHLISGLGITLGAHRAFSHPTFEGPRWLYRLLASCFVISFDRCGQGLKSWVVEHLAHHLHADKEGDPHSPHVGGWWHSFCGHHLYRDQRHWDRKNYDNLPVFKQKKFCDPWITACDDQMLIWFVQVLLAFTLLLIGLLLEGEQLAISLVVWGICVRWSFTQTLHGLLDTWNHASPWPFSCLPDTYHTGTRAVGQFLFWILQLGNECTHNRHHAFPRAAGEEISIKLWHQDADALLMWLLEKLRIIKGCKWLTQEDLRKKSSDGMPAGSTTYFSVAELLDLEDVRNEFLS